MSDKIERIDNIAVAVMQSIHSDVKIFEQLAIKHSTMEGIAEYCYSVAIRMENTRQKMIDDRKILG